MPAYTYKARDDAGKLLTGTMEGSSTREIAEKLRRMGHLPTQIKEASPSFSDIDLGRVFERIKTEDIVLLTIQLANLIEAGIPVLASLKTLDQQIENRKLKAIMEEVGRSVEGGSPFSDALARHPKVFSKLFVSMVRAGEASGRLNHVLNRLAVYVEKQEELRQKIRGALFYPMILICAGIAVITILVTFVIPQFVVIFTKAQIPLPLPTLIVYNVGVGLKHFWYLIVAGIVLVIAGARTYFRTSNGRGQRDRFVLKIPVIGLLIRRVVVSRFSRTLGTLVESGVPILQGLDILGEVVGNEVFRRVIGNARRGVEQGERISPPLKVSGEFPPDAVQMIASGEETGELGFMLGKVADFYDGLVERAVKKLTTLIEPVFIVILGALVGLIMASMLLPIFDLVKTLR